GRRQQFSPRAAAGGENYASADLSLSVGRANLDETREFQLAIGNVGRPQIDLFAVLPLQHQAGDGAGADLERVRVGGVPAFELDAADRADVVGLFQRLDQLVGIG